jgi:NitT/TauT family transport system substrate-binding protein
MIARRSLVGLVIGSGMFLTSPAFALDEVTFGTNWKAQPEHGGFYQAVATGIYEKAGLKVTIRSGGPQVNHAQLLAAGKIDFNMGDSMFEAFNYVQNDVPMVTVAAMFQKDPQLLIAHPGASNDSLEAIQGEPVMIYADARTGFRQFLKIKYGYTDDQIRPYTFNMGPFLADESVVQQGYATSEPFAIRKQGGFDPVVMLLADAGYETYSTTI